MISGISSSFSSYTSSTSATSSTSNKKFQEELLAKLDTDGDGSIGKNELSSALSSNSKDGITVSLSKAFSDLDSNDDDSLDADELAAMTPPPPPPMQSVDEQAEDLLGALDSDGDGAISSDELTTGLSNAGSTANSNQVFDALDTDEDGTVSLEELVAGMQPQQPPAGMPPAQMSTSDSTDSASLFSALDSDSNDSISASELSAALKQSDSTIDQGNTNQIATQALNKMIAALSEKYDTQSSKPVGKYLDTAA
ncbi:EF-hand domain-containing protein [Pseudomonas syringae]|uniref:EF-hand domain-containing protein n=1 Tax=Pseudomonas syringae pv. papulans TaxID=83963 RepID=A0A0Q0CR04_PSESX|nr:EF-hand domain-containing protein [Pseudomonas syringae]KPY29039.1 Calcium-binding protein [Pseudomonas syringae pv. papulans]KWS33317.1 calcium-binding protein [Pseudomonas syringae pv. papulans]MDH4601936.1 EF-hand domain-containing protein [Pseudomonas syringae pv. papulans]MDH4623597.1 EF-hand domain-containing protein [Pseudomonas syringae pv. papulans]RMN37842.1 Calcium-binding protein [Pseudomonas syringae pv. papulans]